MAAKKKRKRAKRVVVESAWAPEGLYQRELVKCGKPKCRRCKRRATHGPYWYLYRWVVPASGRGRLQSVYIGKELKKPDPF